MVREGYINKVIFQSDETAYAVFSVETPEGDDVFVGTIPGIAEGMYIQAEGEYIHHPQYDIQFKCTSAELSMPDDTEGIKRFLVSGVIKGVKEVLATRIIQKFGKDTLKIMEEQPERLAEVKGITEKKAIKIAVSYRENSEYRKVIMFLTQYGIGVKLAMKIYSEFGEDIYRIIRENPYRIADEIPGVGFKTADNIAMRAGIPADSRFRLHSAVLYVLNQSMSLGHIFIPESWLVKKCYSLVETTEADDIYYEQEEEVSEEFEDKLHDLLLEMSMAGDIVMKQYQVDGKDMTVCYARWNYYSEASSARMLMDLKTAVDADREAVDMAVRLIEEDTDIELEDEQREAVKMAVTSGVSVITGGPGTGKTTIINVIIRYFESRGQHTLLAAPTGRAAKRITESTGYKAQTIHRLLEFMGAPSEDDSERTVLKFMRNEDYPLECDAVIVDEASMLDNNLLYSLLKAITPGTKLIFVGDTDQLPSVGAGNVLHDIISSGCFSVAVLNKIFRQSEESAIVTNAHKIKKGEHIEITNKSSDFFFIPRQGAADITEELAVLLTKNLPGYLNVNVNEIEVLSPMRKQAVGVEELNKRLQSSINPPSPKKAEKEHNGIIFREGDKVMQIKNNYKLEWRVAPDEENGYIMEEGVGVFNGDMGIIKESNDFDEIVEVCFDDGRIAEYNYKELDELEHSFAITIHKSQGSEYPAVIIPLLSGPKKLFTRNLLYTAVTRAKRMVVIVGNLSLLDEMIDNTLETKRFTSLTERILEIKNMEG